METNFTRSVCDLCLRVERMDSAKIDLSPVWSKVKGNETAEYDCQSQAKTADLEQQEKIEQVIIQVNSTLSQISDVDRNDMKLNTKALEKLTELKRNLTKQSFERGTRSCKDYLNVEKKKTKLIADLLDEVRDIHPHWSILTFVTMFLPGLVVGVYILFSKGLESNASAPLYECPLWFRITMLFLGLLTTLAFPIGLLTIQVFESLLALMAYRGYKVDEKITKTMFFVTEMLTAMEAFCESSPQICLQIYIVCAKRKITATQAISIAFSLFMLAKTTIVYDMMYNSTGTGIGKRSFSQTAKYLLAIMPLYVSSVIFKAGSIATFFVNWPIGSAVGLCLYFLVLLLITLKVFKFRPVDGIVLSLTNLTVVS